MEKQKRKLQILQLTDLHLLATSEGRLLNINTEQTFLRVLDEALLKFPFPDLILFTGDLAQEPCLASYRRLLQILQAIKIPCVCQSGNHDDFSLMQKVLNAENVNCNSNIFFENWQIICLNSQVPEQEGGRISSDQLIKLEKRLAEYPDKFTLLSLHHHSLPIGSAWMDAMGVENGHEFLQTVSKYSKVKGIVSGHIHQEFAEEYNDIQVYGTPSTCFQFKPKSPVFGIETSAPGYRWLSLGSNGKIETTVYRLKSVPADLDLSSPGY